MNNSTRNQMTSVILLDILDQLNKQKLDQKAYRRAFEAEFTKRTGTVLPLDTLMQLIGE